MVDPAFNFETEERSVDRLRHRTDVYAHELFARPPFDGMLVSKAIVKNRYSLGQQQRLLRLGVRRFLRLRDDYPIIGDCGAFSYRNQEVPPYSTREIVEFYEVGGFTYGISVDHVILAYDERWDDPSCSGSDVSLARARRELTLNYASEFLRESKGLTYKPIGVAQGWSPQSYADSVQSLQLMGYDYIAIGGLVPLKTREILNVLERLNNIRKVETRFHLLGITRLDNIANFRRYGACSFDSTSPLLQAFKSETDNFHTNDSSYMAIRVPQVDGNPKLKARILAGEVSQAEAIRMERCCLEVLKEYARKEVSVDVAVDVIMKYGRLCDADLSVESRKYVKMENECRRTLNARPWEEDSCPICKTIGHQVIIFRGAERNRRRGFHNLDVLYRKLTEK